MGLRLTGQWSGRGDGMWHQKSLRNIFLCAIIQRLLDRVAFVLPNKQFSRTAVIAAAARAAHLIVDADPPIFTDHLAGALLGEQAEELLAYHRESGTHPVLAGARAQAVTRARYTEDRVAESIQRGVDQYIILGAGLDTFAYRSELATRVRVFEVDHPAMQEWKRRRLSESGIAIPPTVTYVPLDLETDSLADSLVAAGFDPSQPAIVSWLGVTVYLTRAAIGDTLATLGRFAPGTEVIVDYLVPAELRDAAGQAYVDLVMPVAAQGGEPWLTFLAPGDIATMLHESGYTVVEHVRQRDMIDASLWDRRDCLRPTELAVITRASVRAPAAHPSDPPPRTATGTLAGPRGSSGQDG
jgi:methyltransferase (TIGR00027 family)